MERIWLKSYPPGMPADVTWDEYKSVGELFEKSAAKYAERAAFHCMGKTLSFAQIDKMSRDFAAWVQAKGGAGANVLFGLYILATTVLFAGVPWSKFAHMFFKPAAALEKRVTRADGTAENLPTQTRDDPEQQKRHSMELLQNAPMDMGLGIKREAPRHY